MKRVYLDNGSTSYPKAPGVGQAVFDFIENIGEHSVGVAHHAGSVQDDRVDLALVKRFDTVQDDVRRTEEVLGIQHDRLGAGEGIHRRVAGYHCACRNQLGGHPVQRQIGGDGRGQRRADTHDGGEGGNGLGNVLVEQGMHLTLISHQLI